MTKILESAPNADRKTELYAELEQLDTVRDHARTVLRSLLTLQHSLDANPVKFRPLYDRNVDACDHYMRHVATLTIEFNRLDAELTSLCPRATTLRTVVTDQWGEIVDADAHVTPGILAELEVSK